MATKDLVLSCQSKSKILKWHVKQGETVKKGQILATYIFTEKVDPEKLMAQCKLKAKLNGKVVELSVKPNDEILKGNVVARLEEELCEHNTIMKEMCCDCGADLRKEPGVPGELSEPTTASQPVVHNIHELKVSLVEAQRLAKQDQKQLLKARKLVLVVDLDMTLIHTTVQPVPKNTEDVYSFKLQGHQYEYHTKLRPDAREFLENISKYYELHIFTMGSRMYAHTIAKILDPDGKHFAHRIRSRDEFINSFSKFHDLKALFPCGDQMVCIIDDREDVWNFAPNLIMVKPYKYFKGSDDINDPFKPNTNNSKGNPKLKSNGGSEEEKVESNSNEIEEKTENGDASNEKTTGQDETKDDEKKTETTANNNNNISLHKDTDDYLYFLGTILERIHTAFYETLDKVKEKGGLAKNDPQVTKFCSFGTVDPDVRIIAPELRRQTLKGCNIVFTGVVPTNVPLEKSRPWRTAVGLGARVTADILQKKKTTDQSLCTTHVVAARHGTQKSYRASKDPKIRLVNPNWLWCAGERWERPEESIFPVPLLDGKTSPANSRQGTPQHNPFEPQQQKPRKHVSPLAQDGFQLPGGYDPESFLENVNPLGSFSKGELDAMDKEVEELMQSENDNSSGDEDKDADTTKRSTSRSSSRGSKKRKRTEASKNSSSSENDEQEDRNDSHNIAKKKTKKDDKSESTSSSSSSSSSSNSDGSASSSSSSSNLSDESEDDEDEENLGNMLERKLSESS